jgi:hypothetical protein
MTIQQLTDTLSQFQITNNMVYVYDNINTLKASLRLAFSREEDKELLNFFICSFLGRKILGLTIDLEIDKTIKCADNIGLFNHCDDLIKYLICGSIITLLKDRKFQKI